MSTSTCKCHPDKNTISTCVMACSYSWTEHHQLHPLNTASLHCRVPPPRDPGCCLGHRGARVQRGAGERAGGERGALRGSAS